MKNFAYLFWIILATAFIDQNLAAKNSPKTADEVLQTLFNKLKSIEHINYTYYRDVNYFSENHRSELIGDTYLDFEENQNVLGFRFQIESSTYKTIFDGNKSIFIDKEKKNMNVSSHPSQDDFSSLSFFVNSIVTLRGILPAILLDKKMMKGLTDTTLNGKEYFVISFTLENKIISNMGTFRDITSSRNVTYKIFVNKNDYLPFQVIQTNSAEPKDYVLTRFSDYKINNYSPPENTWFYLTYANEYRPIFKN